MVLLGGLELVAAGYLINKHHKNKQEARRIREEEDALEESRYRIYSADNAGLGRRRTHSQDRKHSHSHRRHSHERRYPRNSRRDDRKNNYERPQKESRPQTSRESPPVYVTPVPVVHQTTRPQQPVTSTVCPPVVDPSFPPTGWPQHWEQSQRPVTPQPQVAPMPPNLAPYYRDPAQADVKYGFTDEEGGRGREQLRPEGANRGVSGGRSRRGSSRPSVRFGVPVGQRQPGDEAPPAYRP